MAENNKGFTPMAGAFGTYRVNRESKSISDKAILDQDILDTQQALLKSMDTDLERLWKDFDAAYEAQNSQLQKKISLQIDDLAAKRSYLSMLTEEKKLTEEALKITAIRKQNDWSKADLQERLKISKEQLEVAKKEAAQKKLIYDTEIAAGKDVSETGSKEALDNAEDLALDLQELVENLTASIDRVNEEAKRKAEEAEKKAKDAEETNKRFQNALNNTLDTTFKGIDTSMATFTQYQGKMNALLQGTSIDYGDITSKVSGALNVSPFATTTAMMGKVNNLLEEGITYNIEQRAFLATISDKIAATFDAANGTLMRLIRLQQADTTGARLAMEASLTKLFNNMFQDSSYFKDTYRTVSDAIIDANSQLTRDESAAFEYTVQKWLGSLSSVGASSSFVQTLATGLNYLGTGDVSALASNTQLQNLFAMAFSRSNYDYADVLKTGLTSDATNALLYSLVNYLQEVYSSGDQVTKSQFGKIFGVSMSDLRAISNLTGEDLTKLGKTSMTYEGLTKELTSQLLAVPGRLSTGELLSNLYGNFVSNMAESIATNPALYMLWKSTDLVGTLTKGINIPFVSAAGFGLDLNTSVDNLMRLGIAGMGLITKLPQTLSGLYNFGGLSLKSWGGSEFNTRGSADTGIAGGVSRGLTYSAFLSGGSSSDLERQTLQKEAERAEALSKDVQTSASEHADDRTAEDLYSTIFEERTPIKVEFDTGKLVNVNLSQIASVSSSSYLQKQVVERLATMIYNAMLGKDPNKTDATSEEDQKTLQDLINAFFGEGTESLTAIPVTVEDSNVSATGGMFAGLLASHGGAGRQF